MEGCILRVSVLLAVAMAVVISAARPTGAEMSPEACKAERRDAIKLCKAVLYGQLPTPQCCQQMRSAHVKCVFPAVTPKLAGLINVNRAVRLIEGCGRRVPHHFKCGSITTP